MTTIDITIPLRLPTRNELDRMHFHAKKRIARNIAELVAAELMMRRCKPAKPLTPVRITIERHSSRQPDHDNLNGSVKQLLDVLQPFVSPPPGTRKGGRPLGLDVIAGDDPKNMPHLTVMHVKAAPGTERTRIIIQRIDNERSAAAGHPADDAPW
jgi:hypothetical protein